MNESSLKSSLESKTNPKRFQLVVKQQLNKNI